MLLEVWIAKKRKASVYRLNDAMTDIGSGMGDQSLGIFFNATSIALLGSLATMIQEASLTLTTLEQSNPITWVVAMLGVDFCFYWYHRFCHRVNWAWATHAVHHHSEDYNLAVALRQPFLAKYFSWMFYIPILFLGVPPIVIMGSLAFNLLYQFWIHTQLIGKMGTFEFLFNTPSHHRVHHGTNPQYIDKNYGGVLIVWDRLFGTFAQEDETVTYGTIKPVRSWNAIWSNFVVWKELWQKSRRQKSLWHAIIIWWMPPEWDPTQNPGEDLGERGYDQSNPPQFNTYLASQVPVSGTVMAVLMLLGPSLPLWLSVSGVIWVFVTILTWGGLFEEKTWGKTLELFKFMIPLGVACFFVIQPNPWQWAQGLIITICLFYMGWFLATQKRKPPTEAYSNS